MDSLLLCAVFSFLSLAAAQEPGAPRILASKHVLNQYLVQKKDVVVEYHLYNIGESTAYDVDLVDDNFSQEHFTFIGGFANAHWDRIPPNQNVSHALILQPKNFHYFNFTAAQIQYRSGEGKESQPIVGYTSAPGEGQIWESNQFNRQFTPHYADWITFLIMIIPTVGIPYLLWYRSKSRYDVNKNVTKKAL